MKRYAPHLMLFVALTIGVSVTSLAVSTAMYEYQIEQHELRRLAEDTRRTQESWRKFCSIYHDYAVRHEPLPELEAHCPPDALRGSLR